MTPGWEKYDYEDLRDYRREVHEDIKDMWLRLSQMPTCLVPHSTLYQVLIAERKHYVEVQDKILELARRIPKDQIVEIARGR